LGNDDIIPVEEIDSGELKWQAWVIKNVGELLAYTSHLSEAPAREQVARALTFFISQTAQGNITEFARKLGLLKSAVWQWQASKALPQLLVILKICHVLKISLLDFLFHPEVLDTCSSAIKTIDGASPKAQHLPVQFDTSKVQKSLEDVLLEEPPPSMESVAKRFKISARSMRRRFPELCTAISTRHLKYREKIREAKIEQSCAEVRQVAINLYNEGIDPTRSYISRYLSKPAYFREPSVSAALTSVRKELGLEQS
jgi:transcriptional regulator with XRE-family HTH domain